jgi:hypothetical protein
MATCSGNLAELAVGREDWPGAEALAREVLLLAEAVGRQELIAELCYHVAKALSRQGTVAEGLPFAQWAVALYICLGSAEASTRSPDPGSRGLYPFRQTAIPPATR